MGHENDRYNVEFKIAVKDLTINQINALLRRRPSVSQFNKDVLRRELERRLGCKIEGCKGKVFVKGLCAKHYTRMRRTGNPNKTRKRGRKPSIYPRARN
jgi:hypothetical protein